jgi:hypothetical protein
MDLSRLADLADLLGAIGVIASLLFVAYEVRRNTAEARRANWESSIDRFNALWSRTSGEQTADVLHRGRQSFLGLSGSEQIVFSNWYNELCLTYETMIVLGNEHVLGDKLTGLAMRHLQYYFGFAGAREWWQGFASNLGLSSVIMDAIDAAIRAQPAAQPED